MFEGYRQECILTLYIGYSHCIGRLSKDDIFEADVDSSKAHVSILQQNNDCG